MPFVHGNNRLARLIIHLIGAQEGISPFVFNDKTRYIQAIRACINKRLYNETTKKMDLSDSKNILRWAEESVQILSFYFVGLFADIQAMQAKLAKPHMGSNDLAILKEVTKIYATKIPQVYLAKCASCATDGRQVRLYQCSGCKLHYCSKQCASKKPEHKNNCLK